MRPQPQQWRRGLLYSGLAVAAMVAPACRFGYQELDNLTAAAATSNGGGSPGGGPASGSSGSAQSGGVGDGAGTQGSLSGGGQVAQGGSSTAGDAGEPGILAGAPATGGGGTDGTSGAAGTAGTGGAVSGCTDTTDCTCAASDGHSYWFCKPLLNYAGAETQCETQAMHLVRIDSQTENDFLVSEGTPRGVFAYDGFVQIGASDQATQGMWLWFDGTQFWQGASNGMPVGGLYAHWANASPSGNGNKPCSGMLSAGTWQDRSCTALDSFICEAP